MRHAYTGGKGRHLCRRACLEGRLGYKHPTGSICYMLHLHARAASTRQRSSFFGAVHASVKPVAAPIFYIRRDTYILKQEVHTFVSSILSHSRATRRRDSQFIFAVVKFFMGFGFRGAYELPWDCLLRCVQTWGAENFVGLELL